MTARVRVLLLAAAVPALAGCGGGDGGGSTSVSSSASGRTGSTEPPSRRDEPASVRTIRGWVDAERNNRMAEAARYFSLPSIVLNGNEPLLLRSREQVQLWNASLPCGAVFVRAVDVRGWTVVRFRLTSREAGRCDGIGHTASTAFALRKGKIALWIRVRDDVPPAQAAPPNPPDRDFLRTGRVGGRQVPGTANGAPAI